MPKAAPPAKRGGARKGAGPKPDPAGKRSNLVALRLNDTQYATAERLGKGNLSAGIRAALDRLAAK
jgi:hypothetical protein